MKLMSKDLLENVLKLKQSDVKIVTTKDVPAKRKTKHYFTQK